MKSVRLVPDLAENLPADTAYTALKNKLMDFPFLTNLQKIERLHLLDNLGARKPPELELCPRGQEKNKFFLFLFLQSYLRSSGSWGGGEVYQGVDARA